MKSALAKHGRQKGGCVHSGEGIHGNKQRRVQRSRLPERGLFRNKGGNILGVGSGDVLIAGALHHQLDTLQIRHRSSPVEDDVWEQDRE